MEDSIEDSMERWSASPLPYYFGSFDTNNYIIFKNVEILIFFLIYFSNKKTLQRKIFNLQQYSPCKKTKNLKIN
jgi:hypothetical protein